VPDETGRQLFQALGDLAIELQAEPGTGNTVRSIVKAAVDIVPGTRWAGISMVHGQRVTAEAPTDPVVAKLDDLQTELGDGPCISALREHRTVHVSDMSTETRWPTFSRRATELGVSSLLSFQLFVISRNLGALNLYSPAANAFTWNSIEVGLVLAQHAAVAMFESVSEGQFKTALASRDTIGQAKGMLMERFGIDDLAAFKLLTRLSQDMNTPLRDVAQQVIDHPERHHD
jgi:GAF domain-containing protein